MGWVNLVPGSKITALVTFVAVISMFATGVSVGGDVATNDSRSLVEERMELQGNLSDAQHEVAHELEEDALTRVIYDIYISPVFLIARDALQTGYSFGASQPGLSGVVADGAMLVSILLMASPLIGRQL